ncbi:hypothetical protein GCM10009759_39070 [Kitasatospora saccharophila]|uniref:Mobilization protein MobC n=1 Tax=Kitasatospora saccharophila TaxID=407973 RepID=A0ABN2X2T7_9ACTN
MTPSAASPDRYREGAAPAEEEQPTAATPAAVRTSSAVPSPAVPRAVRATEIAALRRKPKRRQRDAANLKNAKITVRFNPDEAAGLRRRAGELGVSVSALIARKALADEGSTTVSCDGQLDAAIEELAALRPQVAGIGRNINQIVRDVHRDAAPPPGPVRDAFAAATELLVAVRTAVAGIDRTAMRLAGAGRG